MTISITQVDMLQNFRIRTFTVVESEAVTSRMMRVWFSVPDLDAFVSPSPSDDIRLQFPVNFNEVPIAPEVIFEPFQLIYPEGAPETVIRAYTVRKIDRERGLVAIDIALHDGGVASDWARQARAGQVLNGTNPIHSHVIEGEGHHLLIGDETALPAIGRWVEEISAGNQVTVIVEVDSMEDAQQWETAGQLSVQWLIRDAQRSDALAAAVREVAIDPGNTVVFAAGEAGMLRPVRTWFRTESGIDPALADIHGYWKRGTKMEDITSEDLHE